MEHFPILENSIDILRALFRGVLRGVEQQQTVGALYKTPTFMERPSVPSRFVQNFRITLTTLPLTSTSRAAQYIGRIWLLAG